MSAALRALSTPSSWRMSSMLYLAKVSRLRLDQLRGLVNFDGPFDGESTFSSMSRV